MPPATLCANRSAPTKRGSDRWIAPYTELSKIGFAESTRSDLKALAACARGAKRSFQPEDLARIETPALICVGTRDEVAGDPHPLGTLFRQAHIVDIPGRDHNRAVGDRVYKQAVVEFLAARP